MFKALNYYLWVTYRRNLLDKLQKKYSYLYRGIVLDIGGRDRGKFKKPKESVEKWIFADIEKKHNPDILLDVANMPQIKSESIDVVNAIELFEHVERIDEGLNECYRVLKKDGVIIIAIPFLYPIHADPFDFQRWTKNKWWKELEARGFNIIEFEIMGRYFTIIGDMKKTFIRSLPKILKLIGYLFYPLLDLLVKLDNTNFILNNKKLNKYHGGYFIIAKK